MISPRPNYAPEVRRALCDVRRLLEQLGLFGEGREHLRQGGGGWLVRCPWHDERTPSCSVRLGPDGTIAVKCHACDHGGDALSLIAAARGLDLRADFRAVLAEGARLGRLWHVVDALEGRQPREAAPAPRPAPRTPVDAPPREWPPVAEVEALWRACGPVEADAEVTEHLRGRSIDPAMVDALEIARALPAQGALPRWARYRGAAAEARSWRELGYRLIVPMFDARGGLRSVRAWRVMPGDGPKRLPPGGHKASELVMADDFARAMLAGTRAPEDVVVVEGEPDFVARCLVTHGPRAAIVGIVSGSWTRALAERLPVGCRVAVRTDHDQAGDRYAAEIIATLKRRCFPFRSRRDHGQAA